MSYEYLENITSDAAFRAWGSDINELFKSASDALVGVMLEDPELIEPRQEQRVKLESDSLEMLLFDVLQELVFFKDAYTMIYRYSECNIHRDGGVYRFSARAYGESFQRLREHFNVDVKGVSMHQFSVHKKNGGWEATVVVDI
ncbi:Archease [Chitinispirillum alkaliphilum]|nr:Archease [Chitinispirillum alkaliphilum]